MTKSAVEMSLVSEMLVGGCWWGISDGGGSLVVGVLN